MINNNTVIQPIKPEKRFFIRQRDGSKKILNRTFLQKTKQDDFNSRLGKQVIIQKHKQDDFNSRLGKQVIIQKHKPMDKLIRKQRYLNTTSNKKKLLDFNQDSTITDLEQIRLIYWNIFIV